MDRRHRGLAAIALALATAFTLSADVAGKAASGGSPYPDKFYTILGLEGKTAGERGKVEPSVIKKAYRKLAMELHPDKVASLSEQEQAAAVTRLAEVQHAYEVLSEPERRKHYDRYGFDELDEQTPYADKDKKLVDFYEGSKQIVQLTPKTYKKIQEQVHITWVVEFYAPWCGPCRATRVEYRKLGKYWAEKPDAKVRIAGVNCDKHVALCDQNGVHSYPTIWVFPKGKQGSARPIPQLYPHDEKTVDSLLEFMVPYISNEVIEIDNAEFSYEKVVVGALRPVVIAYGTQWCGPCNYLDGSLRSFASKLKGTVVVAHVDCTEGSVSKKMCDEQQVALYPTVFFYMPGTSAAPGTKLWPSDVQGEMASASYALSVIGSLLRDRAPLVKLLSGEQSSGEAAGDADRAEHTGADADAHADGDRDDL